MNLELNKIYHGFKILSIDDISDINSIAYVACHEKSGANLLFLKNNDDNKVFSITFKTTPTDNTGVAHILEHSVLCGSRKFPSKEPFVEFIKGSLNTFLNAMTYNDKTVYPIASRVEKDFFNLMDVYLDAVFYPNIYSQKEILMQEGWHYDITSEDQDLAYKGVVYNEMKGALSAPEGVLNRLVLKSLFPNNTYGFNSGGDPKFIPDLTQENFLKFHKKYYHPSNSYIFLSGDLDIDKALELLNDGYLKDFSKQTIDSNIELEKPFENVNKLSFNYPLNPSDDDKNKTFLSLNYVISECDDAELNFAMSILEHMLLESPSAPVKKALLDAKIGTSVMSTYSSGMKQPYLSVTMKESCETKLDTFINVFESTLKDLVSNGIDKKLIEASINSIEFYLRESNVSGYPKGLIHNLNAIDSWIQYNKPLINFEYTKLLEKIRTSLSTNYFENLIEKYILNSTHSSIVILKPDKTLEAKETEELNAKLKKFKSSLSSEQFKELIDLNESLNKRQSTPDSEEALNSIPLLQLDDISPEVEELPLEEKKISDVTVLHHDLFTSSIAYFNLYFDATVIPQNLLQYASLLTNLLTKVSTNNYGYGDLYNEIGINTGGIGFQLSSYTERFNDSIYYPKFVVSSKCLFANFEKLSYIIKEILLETKFDEKDKIKQIVNELKSNLTMNMMQRGHIISGSIVLESLSESSKFESIVSGNEFFKFICDLSDNFDAKFDELKSNLETICKLLFNKNSLLISLGCTSEEYNKNTPFIENLISNLDSKPQTYNSYKFDLEQNNLGLIIPGPVQYCAKGANYRKLGFSYNGSLQVLKTICSFDYLWNRVRLQGGAYGSFSVFYRNGNMFLTSYRDPNITKTLDAYNELFEYVQNFEATDRQMTKYIIGSLSDFFAAMLPSNKCQLATSRYITHTSVEDVQKELNDILKTKVKTIRSLAQMIKLCMDQNNICVLGNENNLKANSAVFDVIEKGLR